MSENTERRRILFAEDQQEKNSALRDVLKDTYEVDTSEDAGETYEKLKDNEYDLLILDIMMPVGSLQKHIKEIHAKSAGITVLNWLRRSVEERQTPATVPVVVITAIINEDNMDLIKNLLLPEEEWAAELLEEDWATRVTETGWAEEVLEVKSIRELEKGEQNGQQPKKPIKQRKAENLFFLKPYDLFAVLDIVEKILAGGE